MNVHTAFKTMKGVAATLLFFLVALLILAISLRGMVWVSDRALPWLNLLSTLALAVCIVVLLPLCLFRRTQGFAGNGLYVSSFVFGAALFAYGCIVAYEIWGYGGLIFGLLFAGIGVVPVAYLATIFHGHWLELAELVFDTVLTFGIRAFGLYLISKAARRTALRESEQEPIEVEGSASV